MATEQFSNFALTNLSLAMDAVTTTVSVVSAATFPSSAQYRITIDSEIMIVTAGGGTTSWTVTRGAEGTTAVDHPLGAHVSHVLTAGGLAGAFQRSLGMFFNVLDFGAACTLGTDDTSAIAATVAAIVANGGGTIYFPRPTTGCLVLPNNVNVVMAPQALLQLPAGSTNPVVDTANWSTLSATGTGTGAYGGLINNVISGRFDGNRQNAGSGGPCLRLYGAGFTLINVNAYHSATDCVQTEGPDAAATDVGDTSGLTKIEPNYHSCWFHDSSGHGWRNNGPHDAVAVRVISYRNTLNGFYQPATINTHGWSAGMMYIGCHAWGNNNWGLFVSGDAKCNGGRVTSGTQIEGSGNGSDVHGQVSILAANWGIDSSCRIFTQPSNDKVGIVLSGAGEYDIQCSIYGCTTKALDISGVGGSGTSIYRPRINQASGTVLVGSPLAGDVYDPNVSGGVSYSFTPQTTETSRALTAETALKSAASNDMAMRGFVAWNSPTFAIGSATAVCVSQTMYVFKVPVPYNISVTNIVLVVSTLGATLTSNQNIATLYNQAGTKIADTADQSAAWTSTGAKQMALVGGAQPITGGSSAYCWVSVLSNGTTPATFRGIGGNSSAAYNVGGTGGLTGANLWAGTNGTSVTASATFTPSSLSTTGAIPLWVGLS